MSVSGIGSSAAKEYSALYNNQAVASRHKTEEVKASAKTDSVVKTRQREEAVPVYTERVSQSSNLAQQDSATTFPIPSIIAKYENIRRSLMSTMQR